MSRKKSHLALRISSGLSVPVVLLGIAGVAAAAPPSSPSEVALPGSASVKVAHSQKISAAPAAQQRTVLVSLAPRDQSGLDAFLNNLGNPQSADYHKYLTPQQYADRFGPSQQSVDKVVKYLESHGLRVDSAISGKQSISATGTNAQLASAFGTSLAVYRDPAAGNTFVGAESAVKVASTVAPLISNVDGLTDQQNLQQPGSEFIKTSPGQLNSAQQKIQPKGATDQGGGPYGSFTPAELRTAYKSDSIGGNQGAGATIAIVSFSRHNAANPAVFDKKYGISAPPVQDINIDGGPVDPQGKPDYSGQGEVDLDIEVLHSIAPKATLLNYQAPNNEDSDLNLYGTIVKDNRASIITSSWGYAEKVGGTSHIKALSNIFKQAAAQGITVFSAAGDTGASTNWGPHKDRTGREYTDPAITVDYPSADPNVTGVGGTRLYTDSSTGAWAKEVVWNDTATGDKLAGGGGISAVFDRPSWQTGPGVNLNQKRQVPDISSAAAGYQYSLYTVLQNGRPGWTAALGTSAAAPLNAGFLALTSVKGGGQRFGNINPTLYQLGATDKSVFHDVTSGNNSILGDPSTFPATVGYDKASGWGSPVYPNLANSLLKK